MRQLTKEQLGKELEEKIRKGEISVDEAEHEYQDFVNPEPRYSMYGL